MSLINQVKLFKINQLKPHEQTSPNRLKKVSAFLHKARKFTYPIVVDLKSKVVLDGHHRMQVVKQSGCSLIPVLLVNYQSSKITVTSRRKNFAVSKKIIINRALNRQLFPLKTTKHHFNFKLPKINISLKQLIYNK